MGLILPNFGSKFCARDLNLVIKIREGNRKRNEAMAGNEEAEKSSQKEDKGIQNSSDEKLFSNS